VCNVSFYELFFCCFNIQSVKNKIPEFQSFCALYSPCIVCLSETWLRPKNENDPTADYDDDSIFGLPNYYITRKDRETRGGGVAIFVKTKYKMEKVIIPEKYKMLEVCAVDVFYAKEKIRVVSCYRSPDSSYESLESLVSLLKWLICDTKFFVITGDFNIPKLGDLSNNMSRLFTGFLYDEGLIQCVSEPTHTAGNILDFVISIENLVCDLKVQPNVSTSDHFSIFFTMQFETSAELRQNRKELPNFYKCLNVFPFLASLNWYQIFESCESANEYWCSFRDVLLYCINNILPKRKHNDDFGFPISCYTQTLIDEKARIFNLRKKVKCQIRRACLSTSLNRISRLCKRAIKNDKIKYEKSFVDKGSDLKCFFSYVKRSLKRPETIPNIICDSGLTASEPIEKCEEFIRHFSSVFTVDNGICCSFPSRTNTNRTEIVFTEQKVLKVLKKLKNSHAVSSDGIPAVFIKQIADFIVGPLTTMFNVIFQLGQFPDQWLQAEVIPLYKGKGMRTKVENYRPISLTCVIGKVMESLIKEQMLDHLVRNNLLTDHQHGFLPGKSTTTELLECQLSWLSSLENSEWVDVVYLDLAKAFDSVVHSKLLQKCNSYGFDGKLLKYLENFLSGRLQRVKIDGSVSDFSPVRSGVPQGSVLGPLLFLIYVNDMPGSLYSCELKLYADDSKLFTSVSRTHNFSLELQEDLFAFEAWCDTWQLRVNPSKCSVLPIGYRRKTPDFNYLLNGYELAFCESQKDLGVTISRNLSSSEHIHNVVKSASRVVGLLLKTFECRELQFMVRIFCSLVRPILEYACESWSPYIIADIDLIEQVQRRFTKRIYSLQRFEYIRRLELCALEPLELRRLKRDLLLVFKIINGLVKLNFDDFFTYAHTSSTRGHSKKLYPRRSKTNRGLGFFSLRIVNCWNALPETVVSSSSVEVFKTRLCAINLNPFLSGRAFRNN